MLELEEMLSTMGEDEEKDAKLEHLILKYLSMLDDKKYNRLLHEVFFIVHDGHFTCELAKHAVSKMINVNGTVGETVSMEEAENLIKQLKLSVDKFDFFFALNMAYSDYSKVFGSNTSLYVNWTIAYLMDPDAKEGRALRQYFRELEAEE
mgnify:CR=1 FL=1